MSVYQCSIKVGNCPVTGKVAALEFARQVKDDPRLKDLLVVGMCVGGQEMQAGKEAEEVGLLGPVFKVGSIAPVTQARGSSLAYLVLFTTPDELFDFSPCGLGCTPCHIWSI
jgi:hypothetical protein